MVVSVKEIAVLKKTDSGLIPVLCRSEGRTSRVDANFDKWLFGGAEKS